MSKNTKEWLSNRRKYQKQLFASLKAQQSELEKLLASVMEEWSYDDLIYRYYHHSFKVYWLQGKTEKIHTALAALAPAGVKLNERYLHIYRNGMGRAFKRGHNRNWDFNTRPILEAFFHAKYFLEMAVKTAQTMEEPQPPLPSYYAGFLYLYNLR